MSAVSSTIAAKNSLGKAQLAAFERDGLVKADCRLESSRRDQLLDLTERTLNALPGMRPESINCPHAPNWIEGLPRSLSDEWLETAGWSEIVDRVASIIGDDVILWGSQLFCKPAGDGLEVPWHQDGEYWPIEPLNTCSIWLAIDDATVENGCMRYIPGSHKAKRVVPHQLDDRDNLALNQTADRGHFDVDSAADDILLAGEFSLHDVYLIHGSNPNHSAQRRAGLVWRFMSARSYWNRETSLGDGSAHFKTRFDERPLFLMRGQAHANKTVISHHPSYRAW